MDYKALLVFILFIGAMLYILFDMWKEHKDTRTVWLVPYDGGVEAFADEQSAEYWVKDHEQDILFHEIEEVMIDACD